MRAGASVQSRACCLRHRFLSKKYRFALPRRGRVPATKTQEPAAHCECGTRGPHPTLSTAAGSLVPVICGSLYTAAWHHRARRRSVSWGEADVHVSLAQLQGTAVRAGTLLERHRREGVVGHQGELGLGRDRQRTAVGLGLVGAIIGAVRGEAHFAAHDHVTVGSDRGQRRGHVDLRGHVDAWSPSASTAAGSSVARLIERVKLAAHAPASVACVTQQVRGQAGGGEARATQSCSQSGAPADASPCMEMFRYARTRVRAFFTMYSRNPANLRVASVNACAFLAHGHEK